MFPSLSVYLSCQEGSSQKDEGSNQGKTATDDNRESDNISETHKSDNQINEDPDGQKENGNPVDNQNSKDDDYENGEYEGGGSESNELSDASVAAEEHEAESSDNQDYREETLESTSSKESYEDILFFDNYQTKLNPLEKNKHLRPKTLEEAKILSSYAGKNGVTKGKKKNKCTFCKRVLYYHN